MADDEKREQHEHIEKGLEGGGEIIVRLLDICRRFSLGHAHQTIVKLSPDQRAWALTACIAYLNLQNTEAAKVASAQVDQQLADIDPKKYL